MRVVPRNAPFLIQAIRQVLRLSTLDFPSHQAGEVVLVLMMLSSVRLDWMLVQRESQRPSPNDMSSRSSPSLHSFFASPAIRRRRNASNRTLGLTNYAILLVSDIEIVPMTPESSYTFSVGALWLRQG